MDTVLIVDDEKNYPLVLAAVLEVEGFEALTANSGDEALDTLESVAAFIQRSTPTGYSYLREYETAAAAYLSLWEHSAAPQTLLRRRVKAMIGVLGRFARVFPIGQPALYLNQGRFHQLCGREQKARSAFERSLKAAASLAMPLDEGRARSFLSRAQDDAVVEERRHAR